MACYEWKFQMVCFHLTDLHEVQPRIGLYWYQDLKFTREMRKVGGNFPILCSVLEKLCFLFHPPFYLILAKNHPMWYLPASSQHSSEFNSQSFLGWFPPGISQIHLHILPQSENLFSSFFVPSLSSFPVLLYTFLSPHHPPLLLLSLFPFFFCKFTVLFHIFLGSKQIFCFVQLGIWVWNNKAITVLL